MLAYTPLEEFQVNTYTRGHQTVRSITTLENGDFIITWVTRDQNNEDADGVYAQLYNPSGSKKGEELEIGSDLISGQSTRFTEFLNDGSYVTLIGGDEPGTTSAGVFAQHFNADGTPRGEEFQVNTYTQDRQTYSDITALADGGFLITWSSFGQDGSAFGVFAQRYNADATPNGEEFQVNTHRISSQIFSDSTALSDGGFIVTWNSFGQESDEPSAFHGVFAQRFNADGTPNGEEFQVNTWTYDNQQEASIQALSDDSFVITWESSSQDGGGIGVFGQLYNPDGTKNGEEFRVNTATDGHQSDPLIAALDNGRFVVAWNSSEQDGNKYGVFAKIFSSPEFLEFNADDFISYTNQDVLVETFDVIDDTEIHITGNTWKALDFEYTVTEDSYVIFDYKTVIEGEIHGLIFLEDGLDPNASNIVHQGTDLIRTDGSQSYGSAALYNEGNGTFQTITVKLSDYYDVGTNISHLVFVNDDDASAAGESIYKNITVREGEPFIEPEVDLVSPTVIGSEEFQVNTHTNNAQSVPTVTTLSNGNFVITWGSEEQDGNDRGVFGQLYNANGQTIGDEFQVNTYTTNNQDNSSLTALDNGEFVVTWSSWLQDGDNYGVFGQRFNADASPKGDEFQINTYTDSNQSDPHITMLNDGGFIVVWESLIQSEYGYNIFGQRYNADGTTRGDEFQINSYTQNSQVDAVVAALSDGGFIVTWGSREISAQRYNADGTLNGSEFQVNTYTANSQSRPDITVLSDDGFIITWASAGQDGHQYGVFGQLYNADGTTRGEEFQINTYTENSQSLSSVTAIHDGGFVVTWTSDRQDGDDDGIFGQRYNADGTQNGQEFQVNTYATEAQSWGDSATLLDGRFVVTWMSKGQDGDDYGIFAKIFRPLSEFLEFAEDDFISYTNQDVLVQDLEVIDYTELHIAGNTWKAVDFDYTVTQDSYLTFDYKTVIEGEIHGLIFLEDGLDPNASSNVHQGEDLIRIDGFQTYGSAALYTEATNTFQTITVKLSDYYDVGTDISHLVFVNDDDANAAGESVYKDIKVFEGEPVVEPPPEPEPELSVQTKEFLVNAHTSQDQVDPDIATLTDGGFIITWTNNSNLAEFIGITGQRYSVDGIKIGEEFSITPQEAYFAENSSVTALSNGGFVVSWQSSVLNGLGIYGKVYDADGNAHGEDFLISNPDNVFQVDPTITALEGGDFVVTWYGGFQDDGGVGVFGRRYNPDGSPNGEEFQVNTFSAFNQQYSSIAALTDGGFVIAWSSDFQDGSRASVFGQRYDADGTPNGDEFQINTFTEKTQFHPSVTGLSEGGFVVTWSSELQDGSEFGIFGQRYDADGSTNGAEFQINTFNDSHQALSDITTLSDGGFVVTWSSRIQDGNSSGVFGQRYDADGSKNGAEFQINNFTTGGQFNAAITATSDNGFVVTWQSEEQDGDGYGIFAKIFRPASEFLEFAEDDFISYTNQDVIVENFEVIDNTEVHIAGNTWKALDFEYTVTENSLVTFDYKTVIEGEIHGLIFLEDGLDPNASGIVHQGLDLIRMDGFQSYGGPSALYTEAADTFQTITVNLSDYYDVGTDISHLVFVNDDDANAAGEAVFKNIKVYEENGIYGDAADNILSGTSEADYLYGDAGADIFLFDASSFDAVDVIGDFDISEGDALDISDVLIGYDAVTDAISDFVQITDNGADSTLSVDINGGADNYVPIAILSNATGLTDEDALETAGNLITV